MKFLLVELPDLVHSLLVSLKKHDFYIKHKDGKSYLKVEGRKCQINLTLDLIELWHIISYLIAPLLLFYHLQGTNSKII